MRKHYQDHPDFIGPRLPKEHPAYLAHLNPSQLNLAPIPIGLLPAIVAQEMKTLGFDDNDLNTLKSKT
jgi:hypothetical protein